MKKFVIEYKEEVQWAQKQYRVLPKNEKYSHKAMGHINPDNEVVKKVPKHKAPKTLAFDAKKFTPTQSKK